MPQGKYITAKNIPPPPLFVDGAGVNFETLNGNCYFLLRTAKSTSDLFETFFSIRDDRWRWIDEILQYVGNKDFTF